jgi:vacuolar-type H+-ATPase subunit I/STV1
MNRTIAKTGAITVLVTVVLFAVSMLFSFDFGSYFVCMLLPIGFIMMTAGFCTECSKDRKTAAYVGMVFAAIYATLILIVYFAQLTVVNFGTVNEQAMDILDFQKGGLLFKKSSFAVSW